MTISTSSKRGLKDHASSLIVTALSAAFGVGLIQTTGYLTTIVAQNDISSRESVQLSLAMVASVFILIAVYVGSIVTANTFATIIAGRTRTIALMRLVGATAKSLRLSVAREGLAVGALGAVIGAALGLAIVTVALELARAAGAIPDLAYGAIDPLIVLPAGVVVVATWGASWVGSRRVLVVTPIQATGAAQERSREETRRRPFRNVVAALFFFGGLAALVAGVVLGLTSEYGFIVAFFGGIASFTGVVIGAHLIIPPLLRLTGRWFGSSASAQMAAENSTRYPERSARTTIGLVIGVTLITTFSVAAQGYADMIAAAQQNEPEAFAGTDEVITITMAIFTALIGFSAVIAAFGMINNLSLSVIQRTRELGLLRALGFTARQVRGMVVAESAQLTLTGVGLGLVLGVLYGWAGAQSLLGGMFGGPGLVWPTVPWLLVVILALGSALLTLVAAQIPARKATSVTPVLALAAD